MVNPTPRRVWLRMLPVAAMVVAAGAAPGLFATVRVGPQAGAAATNETSDSPTASATSGDEVEPRQTTDHDILCGGRAGVSRPWVEAQASAWEAGYSVDVVVEGEVLCDEEPRVRYRARLRMTNTTTRPRWLLNEVCGGQGICSVPWVAVERVDDGTQLPSRSFHRHLYHSLSRLRPGEGDEMIIPLVECTAMGPPLSLRLRYDVDDERRSGSWRRLRDAMTGAGAPRSEHLLVGVATSPPVSVRCAGLVHTLVGGLGG
jgi:hypothetical protein